MQYIIWKTTNELLVVLFINDRVQRQCNFKKKEAIIIIKCANITRDIFDIHLCHPEARFAYYPVASLNQEKVYARVHGYACSCGVARM